MLCICMKTANEASLFLPKLKTDYKCSNLIFLLCINTDFLHNLTKNRLFFKKLLKFAHLGVTPLANIGTWGLPRGRYFHPQVKISPPKTPRGCLPRLPIPVYVYNIVCYVLSFHRAVPFCSDWTENGSIRSLPKHPLMGARSQCVPQQVTHSSLSLFILAYTYETS